MRWQRFAVTAPPDASEAVSALLQELFGGLSTRSTPAGMVHEAYISEKKNVTEAHAALLAGLGRIPAELALSVSITVQVDWVDDEDWAETWKQHYQPIRVTNRLVIVPSWRDWPDPQCPTDARSDDIIIRMDPGMAFGTGAHATTRMCMIALDDHLRPRAEMIDFGCGSGVLSITACKLGARRVLCLDNDPICVEVTAENSRSNGVSERCEVRLGDTLEGMGGLFDCIVANVTPQVVSEQAPNAAASLKAGGSYILSGFTHRSEMQIAAALEAANLGAVAKYHEGEWCCWVAAKLPGSAT